MGHEGARVVAGYIGKSGSGKSTELRRCADRSRRLLVADVKHDWRVGKGDELVVGYQALLDRAEALGVTDPSVGFRFVYRASRAEMELVPAQFCMRVQHCTLVLDEARLFCTPSFIPPALDELVVTGRHASVNLLYAATRPQAVHPSVHGEADVAFLFRLEEPLALARVRENWPGFADRLPTLPMPLKHNSRRRITGNFCTYGNPETLQLVGREGLAR